MPKARTPDPISDHVRQFADKGEQALTDARERWAETLRDLVPGDGDRVRKVVDDAFDFTEKLLESQRELAKAVLDAVLGETAKPAPLAKQAPAAKRAAPSKRAPSTKRAATPKAASRASAA
jgi:hypothetical protein